MIRRSAVVLAALALLVVTGTGGLSTVTADRTAEVAVVPDDRAYLGVQTTDRSLVTGTHAVGIVDLRNRFGADLTDVDVTLRGDDATPPLVVQDVDEPGSLGSGHSDTVTATVACDAGNTTTTETWTVSVTASGDGVSVALERPITVTCEPAPSPDQAA
jgi:hypothetical protein